ncbi:hypothetical protein L3Y34_019737 [Caenorhabditis briggsae]|uniref:HMG box domain-containing protein n=1 Tax=Caenorhabditis briggsae TaxID=6238 RepID=A0AAE9DQQ6_CAEBR|nr:hypothetical protein L3Y34_019737 [Caenorhabditis briggsae]
MYNNQPGTSSYQPQDLSQRTPSTKSSKNSKKEKSGEHIKRPMNPFMLWCLQKRGEMLKSQPGMRPAEVSKQLGEGWKNLTEEEKQPFRDEAVRQKIDHAKNNPDPKKAAGHVKRPMNPFMIWCQKKRGEMLKEQPGMKPSDVSKQLGEGWRHMTDEEKKPFRDEANRMKEDHEKNHPDYKFRPQSKKMKSSSKKESPQHPRVQMSQQHQFYQGMGQQGQIPQMGQQGQQFGLPFNFGGYSQNTQQGSSGQAQAQNSNSSGTGASEPVGSPDDLEIFF